MAKDDKILKLELISSPGFRNCAPSISISNRAYHALQNVQDKERKEPGAQGHS
jgi:hypothetical protein